MFSTGVSLGDLQEKAQLSSSPMFRSAPVLPPQVLSDTSPVSASAARPGSARLCHPVCSAVCCVRPQLKALPFFRVCRNRLCWWEVCLIVRMYSNSPLLWEPTCHPDDGLCGRTEYRPVLSLLCLPTGLTLYIFWRSLYTFLEILVKRSRNQDSHFFNIHLKNLFTSC